MTSPKKKEDSSPASYAWYVGSVYLFNQMIGTGVLAMPKAFVEVGWVLGLIIPCVLAFMSYCTATYVIEAYAIHNAITKYLSITSKEKNTDEEKKELIVVYDDGLFRNKLVFIDENVCRSDKETLNEKNEPGRIHKDSGCVSDDGSFLEYDGQSGGSMSLFRSEDEEFDQSFDSQDEDSDNLFDSQIEKLNDLHKNDDNESEFQDDGYRGSICVVEDEDDLYEIREKAELGDLCKLFFNTTGQFCYYATICLYLTGAEAVYFATIGKSLTSAICCNAGRASCFGVTDTNPCNSMTSISIKTTYRITILTISSICLPMAFFNLSKTRYIQILTMVYRWFAILTMVVLAIIRIVTGKGAKRSSRMASFEHIPNFTGIMLFGFLIQYSISNVVTPVRNKKRLKKSLVLVYACVLVVTSLLTMTAAYGFDESDILDLYTSNFVNPVFFKYALELYPVLALCANIPIFAITLRENLKTLFLHSCKSHSSSRVKEVVFPVLALLPSVAVSLYTYDVGRLVSFTGSYAGAIVEYIIPTVLVLLARSKAKKIFGSYEHNKYQSPFQGRKWSVVVFGWYVVCVSITIYKAF